MFKKFFPVRSRQFAGSLNVQDIVDERFPGVTENLRRYRQLCDERKQIEHLEQALENRKKRDAITKKWQEYEASQAQT